MKYKVLIAQIEKISSPIAVHFAGQIKEFANGKDMAEYEFDKNYLIDSIYNVSGSIHIDLKENDKMNSTNWVGEEQVGFF